MYTTSRQREFLHHLVDICRQQGLPIRYAEVAASLGVSKWTAYDMMQVLERKGLVCRHYATGQGAASGRSQVLFEPTGQGREVVSQLPEQRFDEREWERAKRRILSAVGNTAEEGYHQVAEQLARSLDDRASPLAYWAEAVTALLLAVKDLRRRLEEIPLLQSIGAQVRSPRARLTALVEVIRSLPSRALGSGAPGTGAPTLLRRQLRKFIDRYEMRIEQMDTARQTALLTFLATVLDRVRGTG